MKNEPRVKTTEELQREFNLINSKMEENRRNRTILTQNINSQKKQLEKLLILIEDNNQFNMFPND